jgi:uncharacterized heparinase superfamily protein
MALTSVLYGSAPYHLSLLARAPADLAIAFGVTWPGDAARGAALASGEFRFAGEVLRGTAPPWDGNEEIRPEFEAELHRFGWLADLLAAGGTVAPWAAGEWTRDWLDHCDAWTPIVWRADVVADRLVAWTEHFAEIAHDQKFRARLLKSYARQTRHLRRAARRDTRGLARLGALRGLVVAYIALGRERKAERQLRRLLREVEAQLRPDGGHVERSPRAQLTAMRYLIDAREAMRAAQLEVPGELQSAIDRSAPALRFFRHGDGRLALFNGATEDDAALIELVLARADARGKPPASMPYIGFQRLQAGKTLIVMDAGPPPPAGLDGFAHAGTLSFEMSHAKDRLIVNCGGYRGPTAEWRALARATAAHSTLTVADTNSAEVRPQGGLGRRPRHVSCERAEDQGSQWIEAAHDGYKASFGLVHTRQLFLAADGDDLRGEDKLEGRAGQNFAIRFHLHPSVTASLIQDGAAVLLRLPSGAGWRLRAQGAVMSMAESVYLGGGVLRKSQQIVLEGHVGGDGAVVKWALKREQKEAKRPAEEQIAYAK